MTGPIVIRGRSLRELVPAAYLLRDADPQGGNGMLQALLDLLDAEIATVEDELARRYASLFVETCDDADLAHFQALLGVTQLPGNQHPRALIGNIIGYRRGKGTIATLERVAAAASGWGAHAVDYFRLLGTTQNINHVRTGATTVPVRAPGPLEWAGSPFDPLAHNVDVRARGRYDIPNVGVHLWRLGPVTTVDPSDAATTADPLRYRFHPLGIDTPLYSIGRSLDAMSAAAAVQAVDVTEPIRMSQLRDALADYYGDSAEQSVCVYDDGVAIPVTQVSVRPLDDRVSGAWGTAPLATRVAIDPVRGRPAFAAGPQGPVTVRFVRARPMEIGSRDVADATPATVEVSVGGPVTLDGALGGLPAAGGIVEFAGSGRYAPGIPLAVAGDAAVTIRAGSGNWPVLDPTGVTIACAAGARLTLTGLLVTGAPLRITGSPAAITLDRCTLVAGATLRPDGTPDAPDEPSLILDLDNDAGTAVSIVGCLSGPVRVAAPDVVVTIADSVLAYACGAGEAHPEPVLVGAPLTPFPAWPDGVAGLRLQVGVGLVLDLRLPTAPTSLDDAAQAIRAALATLALDPDVTAAVDVTTIEVAVHDNRLVLAVPGDDEVSAVDASDTDNAATLLALTGDAGADSAWSLLGDPVPEQPVLPVGPGAPRSRARTTGAGRGSGRRRAHEPARVRGRRRQRAAGGAARRCRRQPVGAGERRPAAGRAGRAGVGGPLRRRPRRPGTRSLRSRRGAGRLLGRHRPGTERDRRPDERARRDARRRGQPVRQHRHRRAAGRAATGRMRPLLLRRSGIADAAPLPVRWPTPPDRPGSPACASAAPRTPS